MKTFDLEKARPGLRQAARSLRGEVLFVTERGEPAFVVAGLADDFAIEVHSRYDHGRPIVEEAER
jgi:hypothetical protein